MNAPPPNPPWLVCADTGGTFTDCLARSPGGSWERIKVLSTSRLRRRVLSVGGPREILLEGPAGEADDLWRGLTLVLGGSSYRVTSSRSAPGGVTVDRDLAPGPGAGAVAELVSPEEAPVFGARLLTSTPLDQPLPPWLLRLGTTKATNALLEGQGAPVALFVTAGFPDLLEIGDQRRPDLFALTVQRPPPLHRAVVEVPGRLAADGRELAPLDPASLDSEIERVRRAGCTAAAVALLHSYLNPAHEQALAAHLRGRGFTQVSVSADLSPQIRYLPRAVTAVVDATLGELMDGYLDGVGHALPPGALLVMNSAGGLVPRPRYRPSASLLSGPAGGWLGASRLARQAGLDRVLALDMGGTSTDVSRWEGRPVYQVSHAVGQARLLAPALKIESVAAGGGSICTAEHGCLAVGPRSAGSRPGPACYGAGGPLTLTDVHLLLGRLDPTTFAVPVDRGAAVAALDRVWEELGPARPATREDLLEGFRAVANQRLGEALRAIGVRDGFDPRGGALVAFGGAGGLHACDLARELGVTDILHPAEAGLLSARGLASASREVIREASLLRPLAEAARGLPDLLDRLEAEARSELAAGGADRASAGIRRMIALRLPAQEFLVWIELPEDRARWTVDWLEGQFSGQFAQLFGYRPRDSSPETALVRAIATEPVPEVPPEDFTPAGAARPTRRVRTWQAGAWREIDTYDRADLEQGQTFSGPALVADRFSTLLVEPGWRAVLGSAGTVRLTPDPDGHRPAAPARWTAAGDDDAGPTPVSRALFRARFEALVDEMGLQLQRTALSTNIRERLDFSCALLDAEGRLLVNAPHIPVHLGALGVCVREVARRLDLRPGDVLLTNDPACGGSHLPDLSVITPVFSAGRLLAFLANRAHHAEIGGIRPGSMAPDATGLAREGVVLPPLHLLRDGRHAFAEVERRLRQAPHPSRAPEDNLADLRAQVAANRRGVEALLDLVAREGEERVRAHLHDLWQEAAAVFARHLAARPLEARGRLEMDDGWPLAVALTGRDGRLRIDFTGSGPVHPRSLNATPAIVRSAVVYALRLWVGQDLPLNEGLLEAVDLVLTAGLLNPPFPDDPARAPAVVGGNVETSQRLVELLLLTLDLAAASQGTMNNVVFGDARRSHYETVGGGAGATGGGGGASAIHTHMTNTAITDPEVLEHRFPIRLHRFAIRRGSGGRGRYDGGDGAIREYEFLAPLSLSLLGEHRRAGPPGRHGGEPGAPGRHTLRRADGSVEDLPGAAAVEVRPGDRLILETPGGGGWGPPAR